MKRRSFLGGIAALWGCGVAKAAPKNERDWSQHHYRFLGQSIDDCLTKARALMVEHAGSDNVAFLKYGPGATADIDPKTGETRYIGWVFFSIDHNASPPDLAVMRWANEEREQVNRDHPGWNTDPGPLMQFGRIVDRVCDEPFVGTAFYKYGRGLYYG